MRTKYLVKHALQLFPFCKPAMHGEEAVEHEVHVHAGSHTCDVQQRRTVVRTRVMFKWLNA